MHGSILLDLDPPFVNSELAMLHEVVHFEKVPCEVIQELYLGGNDE